jgi:N-acyl-D-aspartate/D-glutamate deacylase
MHRSLTALVLTLLLSVGLGAQPPQFDLLLRGGRVVDGTGNPSFLGDVAIKDGRVAGLGRLGSASAARIIDASGLVVAPGFIDIHNHSDDTIVEDGDAPSMVRQGVTTMIFGESGSAAPTERWKDFSAYFGELQRRGIATNVGSYIGSGLVWTTVRGSRPGPATPDERTRMQAIVRQAMEQGALGVASSLSGPPGVWIDTDSLVAMCEVAGKYGGGYATHMRTEGSGVFQATAEAIEIGRRAHVPVDILHLKIADHKLWGQMPKLVAQIEQARARGIQVQANLYPYRAGQNNLASIIPPWAHEGGSAMMVRRLQDRSLRGRLEREILNGIPGSDWYNHYTATGGWDGMLLVSLRNPEYKRFQGKRMSEVIRTLGRPPVDVLFQLLIANGGSVGTIFFHHSEADMRYALKQPFVSIGSDGTAVNAEKATSHPHPRYYGTFPRVLGRYVREEKVLSLEEAVRKMTSANAAKIGIYDRGLLRPGQWADVTVFDPAAIIDRATFEKPHQYAAGVEYVIVNGKLVLDLGRPTGARPGTIVMHRSLPVWETQRAQRAAESFDRITGFEGWMGGGSRRLLALITRTISVVI